MEGIVETMDQLCKYVHIFTRHDMQFFLSAFIHEWLNWSYCNPEAYYRLHKIGLVQLRPYHDFPEDAGNKTYMLVMRLCFPIATSESGLRKADKLGDIVESLFGYAQVCGQLQHKFFVVLTEIIKLFRALAPLLPKTHTVQQEIFTWEQFATVVNTAALQYAAENCLS